MIKKTTLGLYNERTCKNGYLRECSYPINPLAQIIGSEIKDLYTIYYQEFIRKAL